LSDPNPSRACNGNSRNRAWRSVRKRPRRGQSERRRNEEEAIKEGETVEIVVGEDEAEIEEDEIEPRRHIFGTP
jgi:hypothetical protein